MEINLPLVLFMVAILAGIVITLGVAAFLVIRDTARGHGEFGVNLAQASCPKCEAPAPGMRIPKNLQQILAGGWTCSECGTECDRWGQPLAGPPRTQPRASQPRPDDDRFTAS